MSENKFEMVSSCVDNYQQHDKAFDEINDDSELSDLWGRYHLMGDIMRNEIPQMIQLDLSSQIADAIEKEPTILAPKTSNPSLVLVKEFKNKVIQFAKPFGQIAIAASAAGLMVLGVQQNNVVNTDDILPNQIFQTNPLGGIAEPVSFNYQQTNRMSQKQAYIQQQRQFQALLSDHQQQIKLNAISINNNEVIEPEIAQDKVENLPK